MAADASLVGQAPRSGTGNATTSAGSVTTGDTTIIIVCSEAATNVASVQDSVGNTYTEIDTAQTDGNGGHIRMWRCQNATGNAAMTATANTFRDGEVYLVKATNVTTTSFDVTTKGSDAATPYTLASGTLGQADEVIITACMANAASGASYASSNTTIIGQQPDWSLYYTSGISKLVVAATTLP